MIRILGTNITSPIGFTTEENYQNVRAGKSALKEYKGMWNLPDTFVASLFTSEQTAQLEVEKCTKFQSLVIRSVKDALSQTNLDITSNRTVFILSTTKAEVGTLPGKIAEIIANKLGFTTTPIVVCNACISGLAAQSLAYRLLRFGTYNNAVVCGVDCQTDFIVSGFQSLKAVSATECRPFDIERLGLNLGEAAATVVLSSNTEQPVSEQASALTDWYIANASVRNDAHHISAPSPKGEGAINAISYVLENENIEDIGVVGVHGTATMFNDQMESKAIEGAGLSSKPLSALKGYYGHTMGAAGILESILTLRAAADGIVLPSRGFSEIGVSGKVNISNQEQKVQGSNVLKILSGFGGCNAAVLYKRFSETSENERSAKKQIYRKKQTLEVQNYLTLNQNEVKINGVQIPTTATGKDLLTELYKSRIGNYPKFYKMDMLSKLGFVASDILLHRRRKPDTEIERAVILFNQSSSAVADREYRESISDRSNFFPSPSVFVYTLPNIVTGEIAIRNGYKGETSLYILPTKNENLMNDILLASAVDWQMRSILCGWIECEDEEHFEIELKIIKTRNKKFI